MSTPIKVENPTPTLTFGANPYDTNVNLLTLFLHLLQSLILVLILFSEEKGRFSGYVRNGEISLVGLSSGDFLR
ncbi:MAG: hypothetical protein CM15mV26_0770 [uncultured marine virus]|nr:MAG: hypothetical protein CM15mV26_0770 [uncultured marine virus]